MNINDLRKKIDIIEDELIIALNKRAEYSLEIGKIKKQEGLPVFIPNREKEILERVAQKSNGPLSAEFIQNIFITIMEESRKLQANNDK